MIYTREMNFRASNLFFYLQSNKGGGQHAHAAKMAAAEKSGRGLSIDLTLCRRIACSALLASLLLLAAGNDAARYRIYMTYEYWYGTRGGTWY